ncbi:hypothetical protein M0Q03_00585 [bacterium]|jgi:hypothetical protein|nr:hypothetical protein [bacterium]
MFKKIIVELLAPTKKMLTEEITREIANKTKVEYFRGDLVIFQGFPEIKDAILERWNQLYLPVIQEAIISGKENVIIAITSENMPISGVCVETALEYIQHSILPEIETTEGAKEIYFRCQGTPLEFVFKEKWRELCSEDMDLLFEPKEFEVAFKNLYWSKEIAPLFISNWATACRSLEEIKVMVLSLYNTGMYLTVEAVFQEAVEPYREELIHEGGAYAIMATIRPIEGNN